MKKNIVQLGILISIYFTLYSIYHIIQEPHADNVILLICSIFCDYIIYKYNEFYDYLKKKKELYEDVSKGKALESKTEEKKLIWYKVICEDIFNNKNS